jgi:hypothetical protein
VWLQAAKCNLARCKVEIVSFCVRMGPILPIFSGYQGSVILVAYPEPRSGFSKIKKHVS